MDFGLRKGPSPGQQAPGDVVKDTTTAAFAKDVIEASRQTIVLVDFWAAWCGPCKQLTPMLEKVVRGYSGKVRLVKLNVDEHPSIAAQLRIQSLPTVYAFRDGRPLDGFMGAQPESAVKAFIERLLGEDGAEDVAAALEAAEQALAANDLQGAAEIYASVLQSDRQNVAALSGLARCYLKSGDIARAEQTIELVPPDKRETAPVTSVRAAIELAKKAGKSGDTKALESKLAANPGDHQARLDLALALAARGDKSGAVDQLIELFRRDRTWNEEAARKQLIELFNAWGPKDPNTIEGRKRLSSLLFS
ncbi:MAG TPA: thioredoxin [Hyphomicrobiaceae bacterium]|nr:thioredoxin [Hyphomicrobiaceae bacterium]